MHVESPAASSEVPGVAPEALPSPAPYAEPSAVPVASGGDCHSPALAVSGEVVHLVWARDRLLHHASLTGGAWRAATRFAAGEQPVQVAGPDGALHCVFANWFLGNCEIYHVQRRDDRWGFPEWVSRTPGISTQPAIATDGSGAAHIVWSDDSAGEPVIYYGSRGQIAWLHAPIPSATGVNPSIAVTRDGEIYVAWQERLARIENGEVVAGPYRILCAIHKDGGWSLPELVSEAEDSAAEAVSPALATGPQGDVHIVWQQQSDAMCKVRYATRLNDGWARSQELSGADADARLPRAQADGSGCHVVWAEGDSVKHRVRGLDGQWSKIETVCSEEELSEITWALTGDGELYLAWSAYLASDTRYIRYTKRAAGQRPKLDKKILLPLTSKLP